MFSEEEIGMFKVEAEELLDAAEKSMLSLDEGEPLAGHYDSVFRALHSIKGAAGMMEMTVLQSHMHQLETIFTKQQQEKILAKPFVDLLLRGFDATRALLNGQSVKFDYAPRIVEVAAPVATAKPVAVAEKKKPIGRILVVDDEPDIVELITSILEGENIEVRGLTDSALVMQAIEDFKPDALFSDIKMPGMSGLELLTVLGKTHADLPVVLISGFVDKESLLQAIRGGVFAVVEKPFEISRVAECGLNAIERSRLKKMLNSSINLLMYQFSDLRDFLTKNGRGDIEKVIAGEITGLLEQRRALRWRKAEAA